MRPCMGSRFDGGSAEDNMIDYKHPMRTGLDSFEWSTEQNSHGCLALHR